MTKSGMPVVGHTQNMNMSPPSTYATARSSKRIMLVGVSIIIVLVGGFGSWASFAPLGSGVMAQGVVVAEGNRSTVQHLEGGIIKQILVEEGDVVVAGQVLVQLDDVQTRAKLGSLQAEYDGYQARNARLIAEQGNQPEINFSDDLLGRIHDQRVRDIISGETTLFKERRSALAISLEMIAQQRALYERHASGSQAQIDSRKIQLSIIQEELTGLEKLFVNGHVAKTRLLKLKREIARLEGDVGEKESQVAQAQIKLIESKVEEIQTKTEFRKEVISELREVQGRLFDLEERILASKDTLKRLDIRAPRGGAILDLQFHAVNAVVMSGKPILDIVPMGKALIIDAKISPNDIDNVLVGAQAEVRFPAFRQRTTPSIFGSVVMVSADTLMNPTTNEPYYTARVIVNEEERIQLRQKQLVPGMLADVTVKSGERTLIEYLLEPLTDVLARSFKE
ncbi:MAG: HlyD family type I secretion periplasmic adaptor subunit [Magnetovibrio sp.]|nr:HlyD family type I secretion periplasmic adaptor subunit [Magnetovibrio sp.]